MEHSISKANYISFLFLSIFLSIGDSRRVKDNRLLFETIEYRVIITIQICWGSFIVTGLVVVVPLLAFPLQDKLGSALEWNLCLAPIPLEF